MEKSVASVAQYCDYRGTMARFPAKTKTFSYFSERVDWLWGPRGLVLNCTPASGATSPGGRAQGTVKWAARRAIL